MVFFQCTPSGFRWGGHVVSSCHDMPSCHEMALCHAISACHEMALCHDVSSYNAMSTCHAVSSCHEMALCHASHHVMSWLDCAVFRVWKILGTAFAKSVASLPPTDSSRPWWLILPQQSARLFASYDKVYKMYYIIYIYIYICIYVYTYIYIYIYISV